MKQTIIGTGLSGLVGSRITEILSSEYEFEDLSFDTGVDITNGKMVFDRFEKSSAKWVLHMAAKTDVEACEKEKDLGQNSSTWKINVIGTQNIIDAAKKYNKKIIYVSTDFVFDGTSDSYDEKSIPNPLNWYALTKFEAEKLILQNPDFLVARISYPYRAKCGIKIDFVHNVAKKLSQNQIVQATNDQIFTPTFIDDIAFAFDLLIKRNAQGIFHIQGSESLSPYEAVNTIAEIFDFPKNMIIQVKFKDFYKNCANRPNKLVINNAKIKTLGVKMRTFTEGLLEIKKQGFIYR